jgi:putative tricarboxylic transport membrane protein
VILRADHVAGGAAIVFGIGIFALSGDLPFGRISFPGAGMLPKLLCGLLVLFGVLMVLRAGDSAPLAEISWSNLPHAAKVVGTTAIVVALYTTLGFIVAMTLLLFALTTIERRNVFAAAVFSIAVSIGTFALFSFVLRSPLDRGIFGF